VRAILIVAALLLVGAPAQAQDLPGFPDPFGLTRPKNFTARRSSSNNPDPNSNDDSKRPIPGETVTLADLSGPGVVTHIWLTVADSEYAWPRLLRLRVYYDGSDVASVDAPVGDFFAVGHGFEKPVRSLMIRDSSDGRSRNSYWPMPFRRSCRITVTNEGRRRVSNLYYHVDWGRLPSLPPDTLSFHARYRQALPACCGTPYEIANLHGRGQYVGTVLSVVQAEAGWFGEGDDHFFVDGEANASIEGTGTEDYFNDAWGLRVDDGPYAGASVAEGTGLGARMTAFRWHLADPIPFRKSLRFEMEHKGWTFQSNGAVKSAFGERTDLMSSVAFWYQSGIAKDQPDVPYGSARLPQGNARQIEVEKAAGEARAEKGKISVLPDLFWSKDVLFLQAEGIGSRLDVPLEVEGEGDYELVAQVAQSYDYGKYKALLDGKPVAAAQLEHEPGADVFSIGEFDGYHDETYVGYDVLLGWPHLTKGRHTVSFVCTGKNNLSTGFNLGVDDLVLARTGSDGWRIAGEARAPRVPTGRVPELAAALDNPDPVERGLAALALKNAGTAALPALERLVAKLGDAEANVRMMSASAIAAIGPAAAPAVPALIAAAKAPGEEVPVLRAVASALGAIGKQAAPALPVLEELAKIPRVKWAADAAMKKIRR
jgi:D-arabinan exo alpha-(1,3)/(1,5)-arabinofuranosidase (non-reducing end)